MISVRLFLFAVCLVGFEALPAGEIAIPCGSEAFFLPFKSLLLCVFFVASAVRTRVFSALDRRIIFIAAALQFLFFCHFFFLRRYYLIDPREAFVFIRLLLEALMIWFLSARMMSAGSLVPGKIRKKNV